MSSGWAPMCVLTGVTLATGVPASVGRREPRTPSPARRPLRPRAQPDGPPAHGRRVARRADGRSRHARPRRRRQPAPPGRRCGRVGRVRTEAPEGTLVLLGDSDGVVHLAVIVPPDEAPGEAEEWVPLRSVLTPLAEGSPQQAPLVMHAIGLAEWHHATRFCPRCGGILASRSAGHELRCTQCDRAQFPRTDPAVIMAITHGDGEDEAILLGRNTRLAGGALVHPRGVLRAGGDPRGRRAPRGRWRRSGCRWVRSPTSAASRGRCRRA